MKTFESKFANSVALSMSVLLAVQVALADEDQTQAQQGDVAAVQTEAPAVDIAMLLDDDGDTVPNALDPMPLVANPPIQWSVHRIELLRTNDCASGSTAWEDSARLEIATALPVPEGRVSLTSMPQLSGKVRNGKSRPFAELGLFGTDTIEWGNLERFRVSRFLRGCEKTSFASPVDVVFTVHFVNLDKSNRQFDGLEVPVKLGGKSWGVARPHDPQQRERGIIVPADGKSYAVEMSIRLPERSTARFLRDLAGSPVAPTFEFEMASGLDVQGGDEAHSLAAALLGARDKCFSVTISGPDNRNWCWRIARKNWETGRAMTFGEWIGMMNASAEKLYGAPFMAFSEGYPVSLAGLDSGVAGKWWHATYRGRAIGLAAIGSLPLEGNLHFYTSFDEPRDIPSGVVIPSASAQGKGKSKPSAAEHEKALACDATRGCQESMLELAELLIGRGAAEGADWLEFAAKEGYPKAQLRFATLLRDGELGVAPDAEAAMQWLKRAADAGESDAMLAYGEALRAGAGVRKNVKLAVKYFKGAAEAGNAAAQTWYAIALLRGDGVRKDVANAITLLTSAADAGDTRAQYFLGVCMFGGFGGIDADEVEAFRRFEQAAKVNDSAKVFLGYCYLTGRGVEKDDARAFANFNEVAEKGLPAGQLWLAYCYGNGIGVDRNVETARKWAKKVADAGIPAGRNMLISIQE